MFDSNGLGPIAAWVVGKSMRQGNKWERRKILISYSRMMICMWFYGIQSTWLVCSCVLSVQSIFIWCIYTYLFAQNIFWCIKSYSFHKCMNHLVKIFQHSQGCKHFQLQKAPRWFMEREHGPLSKKIPLLPFPKPASWCSLLSTRVYFKYFGMKVQKLGSCPDWANGGGVLVSSLLPSCLPSFLICCFNFYIYIYTYAYYVCIYIIYIYTCI